MSGSTPMLELCDLHKQYGAKQVLGGVNLSFFPGSICAVLGKNGAGKTTTMQLIMGHILPTSGEVQIHGRDIGLSESHEVWRRVGYLPDEPVLYEHLTGREFLHFLGEIYGIGEKGISCVEGHFSPLGLLPHIDSPIRTLSLGTKKKIAFLGAILHEPDILILDEPTGTLDAFSARVIRGIIADFRERGGLVVFSTHGMEEAERISDRISILHAGMVRFDGPPSELRTQHGRNPTEPLDEVFIRLTEDGRDRDPLLDVQPLQVRMSS